MKQTPVNLASLRRRVLATRLGLAILCALLLGAAALVPLFAVRHSREMFHFAYAPAAPALPTPAPLTPVPPLTGELVLRSDPEVCAIYLDQVFVGHTPLRIRKLAFGRHQLELKRFPFAPAQRVLDLKKRSQELYVELRERTGQIQLVGAPGTRISVDGEAAGNLPLGPLQLPIGPHRFDGQGPTMNWSKTIEVVESQRLTYDLAKSRSLQAEAPPPARAGSAADEPTGAASLLVSTRPWAEVTFDRREMGFTPLLLGNIQPGGHTLEISRRGYVTERRLVSVKPGERASIHLRLTKEN